MKKAASVENYISNQPTEIQRKLTALRTAIKSAAPKAEEKISYGMPYYHYKGRLAYFRVAGKHIGFYMPHPTFDEHRKEIGDLYSTGATMHLPLEGKLPIGLIKKLVKARIKYNDEHAR
jgi:uncharacterized protein YdhG (YjbR/CyaY superfamily)